MASKLNKILLVLMVLGVITVLCINSCPGSSPGVSDTKSVNENPEQQVLYTALISSEAPADWQKCLKQNGAEIGDYLGENQFLVRLPQEAKIPEIPGIQFSRYQTAPVQVVVQTYTENEGTLDEFNVTVFQPGDKKALAAAVRKLGGTTTGDPEGPGQVLRVQIPGKAVDNISQLPYVLFIEQYKPPQFLNNRASGVLGAAPLEVPGFVVPEGLSGAGQIVAIADTGLDTGKDDAAMHPDFRTQPGDKPKIVALKTPLGAKSAADPTGHGTHIAGSIAGTGAASNGEYRGLAPGAGLYIQSLFNAGGKPDLPVDLAGELFAPAYAAGARIHVDSWGREENKYLSTTAQIDSFIRQNPDFLVVFGAGNNGPEEGTLGPEANSKNALVIGASENPRPGYGPHSDNPQDIAEFSSRGPTADGRIKPELAAPGTEIISAKSSLVEGEGNFPLNQNYLRKDGTSMSTAIAGGAAALLREYFVKEKKNPSAALLKASLINGARRPDAKTNAAGFGLLDLEGTILALKEKTMQYTDNSAGIGQGNVIISKYQVTNTEMPLKVTLAWTDPPASPAAGNALVNNLDLLVVGPDGKSYYGNDFEGKNKKDKKNTVEQVYIPNPVPGEYQIKVLGSSIVIPAVEKENSENPLQDYALVYGQPLLQGTVMTTGNNDKSFVLEDWGSVIRGDNSSLKLAVDDWLAKDSPEVKIRPGTEIYTVGPRNKTRSIYAYYRTLDKTDCKSSPGGLILPLDEKQSEGGYRVAPAHQNYIKVNGTGNKKTGDIIPGSHITGVINPFTGELWNVSAVYDKTSGKIAQINLEQHTLRLANDSMVYRFDKDTKVNIKASWEKQLPWETPFIYPDEGELTELTEGMQVTLVLSKDQKTIKYIEAAQRRIEQLADETNPEANTIKLKDDQVYNVSPRAAITRDGRRTALSAIAPGDSVILTLEEDGSVSGLEAYSNLFYGKLVYANTINNSIVFTDHLGQIRVEKLTDNINVYWRGTRTDLASLKENDYVRLAFDPVSEKIWRIDQAVLAEEAGRKTLFKEYDPANNSLTTSDHKEYIVTDKTLVTKNNLRVGLEDLFKDEPVKITAVLNPQTGEKILGVIEAYTLPNAISPDLTVHAPGNVDTSRITVTGAAPGARVYIYYEDKQIIAQVDEQTGEFKAEITLNRTGSAYINVVAVDKKTGGTASKTLDVFAPGSNIKFSDLNGHWAEQDILELCGKGIIKGYPDGTFRPEQAVSREELVRMLIPAAGWEPEENQKIEFSDTKDITAGGQPFLAAAVSRGLINGYPDNTLRPGQKITRAELAAILMRTLKAKGQAVQQNTNEKINYTDWRDIPLWAREAAVLVYNQRIMTGRPENRFAPQENVTRAEAAVVVARLQRSLNLSE
ncbi:S8 family serine peptidase [Desulfolucanica intricata]|uniref:S8 family serine peptidase n=1 Tax=Desulfolucanica intricata TaxID=1285191 RepID=UPI00082C9870|nr:S8 family serine peptidase [Desulfolucanica intricata]